MGVEEQASSASDKFSDEHVADARTLLNQHPVAFADMLQSADNSQLQLIWIAWLDRADSLSQSAGNTLASELLIRVCLFAVAGVVTGWLIVGFPRAWFGLGLGVFASLWWLAHRRAWQRSTALHVIWGALINAEFKQRYGSDKTDLAKALLEKVEENVMRFTKNYEAWVGRPLRRRIG